MIAFAQRTTSHATHKERGDTRYTKTTGGGGYALHERVRLTRRDEGHIESGAVTCMDRGHAALQWVFEALVVTVTAGRG